MHDTFLHLVATYGYLFLFVVVAIESLGIPLPGETALVTAGALAATGRLQIGLVIASAAVGAIVGDNAGYWIGRKGGLALVRRYGSRAGLDDARLDRARGFFQRYGGKTVFLGRFVALLRSWAAALAGVACMPYGRFTLYNALGGATWSLIFGSLGYAFGRNLPRLEQYAGQVTLAVVLLATLGVSLAIAVRWFRRNSGGLANALAERQARITSSRRLARVRTRHPRLWSFVARRLARGEYLGLHLTIGFFVSLAALWVFGGITEDVIHRDPVTTVDLQLAEWCRTHASALGDRIGVVVSNIGSPVAIAILVGIVAAVLVYRRWWVVLVGWIAANAGGALLDWALKRVIDRPRPTGTAAFLDGTSFSFPSGHAMGSLIAFGMLAYLLLVCWAWARRHVTLVIAAAGGLILAIGLSRLYLAIHLLSDVIGGYAAGAVWLTACITGVEVALRQPRGPAWVSPTSQAAAR